MWIQAMLCGRTVERAFSHFIYVTCTWDELGQVEKLPTTLEHTVTEASGCCFYFYGFPKSPTSPGLAVERLWFYAHEMGRTLSELECCFCQHPHMHIVAWEAQYMQALSVSKKQR